MFLSVICTKSLYKKIAVGTNQIFLKPFNYYESAQFLPNYSNEDKAIVYGVTGGVAKYLTLFDDNISLDENLINNFFKPSGYLYEEPANLLMQEFRSINTYNNVIEVCADGANKVKEIADKAHISVPTLSYILNMENADTSKVCLLTLDDLYLKPI
ncbi:MAG: hypothetical protein J6M24_00125 [Lachnospiraceae bacterium]|nr:hypothetical protein [Lachnospiraceae bacterium]